MAPLPPRWAGGASTASEAIIRVVLQITRRKSCSAALLARAVPESLVWQRQRPVAQPLASCRGLGATLLIGNSVDIRLQAELALDQFDNRAIGRAACDLGIRNAAYGRNQMEVMEERDPSRPSALGTQCWRDPLRSRPLCSRQSAPITKTQSGHDRAWPSKCRSGTPCRARPRRSVALHSGHSGWPRQSVALQITRKHSPGHPNTWAHKAHKLRR